MELVFTAKKNEDNMYDNLNIYFKNYDNTKIPILTSIKPITEEKYNHIKNLIDSYHKGNTTIDTVGIELFKINLYNKLV